MAYKNSTGSPGRSGRWLSLPLLTLVAPKHRSDDAAQIEILVLGHQLQVLRRQVKRPVYLHRDRALLAAASRILPKERWGTFLVRSETLLRWHRSLVARSASS